MITGHESFTDLLKYEINENQDRGISLRHLMQGIMRVRDSYLKNVTFFREITKYSYFTMLGVLDHF